jgi:PAS domain S-box-containing protein
MMADAEVPDLILMDIHLGGVISGIEAAEKILSRHSVPVIYVTAYADPELVERAKKTRPYGYILKPYDERGIRTEVEIALYKFGLDRNFLEEYATLAEWVEQRTEELAAANEALRKSETRYRLLFERTGEGIFIFEAEGEDRGKIVEVNAAGAAIHGYTPAELVTMKITDLDAPENLPLAPSRFEAILQWEWIGGEVNHVRRDGTKFPIDFRSGLLELEGHRYVFSVVRDISERKQSERALQESEAKYRTILENMQDLFYRTDLDGKIVMLSPSAATVSGYDSVDDLIGRDAATMYAEPEKRVELLRVLAEKGTVSDYPITLVMRDGSIRYTTTNSHYYRGADGTIQGVEGVIHDITGLKKTKEALTMANRKLNLLSGITRHDIRNQLMALKAYISLSDESLEDREQLADFLGRMDLIANNIERQIEFTRMYEDMGVKAPIWQNIDALVRNAASSLPVRNVRVEAGCPGLEIVADSLLEKVFYNLIDNALRYGGTAMTCITVSSQKTGFGMVILVEDDGAGISGEDKKRLFERGFGKHTGLGLFLSREILSITGITITETGEPGKGARFEILVPKGAYRVSPVA